VAVVYPGARRGIDAATSVDQERARWMRSSWSGWSPAVLQETYLVIWRAAAAFAGASAGGSAVGWVWTIAARRLVDPLRRRARDARLPPAPMPAHVVPSAEDEALRATVGDEVGEALRRLAPELRQVLQAMVLDGLTVRETAVLLGVPEGTVKTRARRARIALRETLS
jgi:RNA polymerase sigma-70 factor (ECF subfamily)